MHKLVMVRHGESIWNQQNLFTGWVDIDLSEKGVIEAKKAGKILKEKAYQFDEIYTSVLKRALKTAWLVADEMDILWMEQHKCWQLNERHYGSLQGLNKTEMVKKFGEAQVFEWRRSFAIAPPPLEATDKLHPSKDARYKKVPANELPSTESLKTCQVRVLKLWNAELAPKIQSGKNLLLVAHGNSLRSLIKHLDNISDEKISELNLPTGIPLVYELDAKLKPIKSYFLGDEAEVQSAIHSVANQTKK
jgi:2,3-bisphosphoglycerate-dependent phosphoglycerate mutase